jgi:hypothetical protein
MNFTKYLSIVLALIGIALTYYSSFLSVELFIDGIYISTSGSLIVAIGTFFFGFIDHSQKVENLRKTYDAKMKVTLGEATVSATLEIRLAETSAPYSSLKRSTISRVDKPFEYR